MNQSETIETYIGIPTEFSLIVDDSLGFAKAYVCIPCEKAPIEIPYSHTINEHGKFYSVFILWYTFNDRCANNVAQLYFISNGIRYDCDEFHYDVIP